MSTLTDRLAEIRDQIDSCTAPLPIEIVETLCDLADAVESALGLHKVRSDRNSFDWCAHCGHPFPCPTIRAITEALA